MNEKPLLHALAALRPQPRCSVGRLVAASSDELGFAIEQAVADPAFPLRSVEATLALHGVAVHATMIRKHRLGMCSCPGRPADPPKDRTGELIA